jgi:hypothetical protein
MARAWKCLLSKLRSEVPVLRGEERSYEMLTIRHGHLIEGRD